jgi:DNA-binding NtrC family response regulator
MKHAMKNILIVDNDLRFIQWLGRALIDAHQQPWPACTVSDAMVLVDDSEPVDLLIINSYLPHSSDLINRLHNSQRQVKVLAMGSEPKAKLPHVHAWKRKPGHPDPSAEQKWVNTVKKLLTKRTPELSPPSAS